MRLLRILMVAALALPAAYSDSLLYNAQIDTSGLTAGDTYSMDFQFIGSDANTVDLNNFSYGGGSGPTGLFELDTITNFFNEVTPQFVAGITLSFQIGSTNIGPPAGGFPDELSFFILDSSLNPLPTTDTANAFFYLDVTGAVPNIQTFSGSGVLAPIITPASTGVPEPGTISLLAAGLSLILLGLRSRKI